MMKNEPGDIIDIMNKIEGGFRPDVSIMDTMTGAIVNTLSKFNIIPNVGKRTGSVKHTPKAKLVARKRARAARKANRKKS